MMPHCIAVCSQWRLWASRHSPLFHRLRRPSALRFLSLPGLSFPTYTPFLSLGRWCPRSPRTVPVSPLGVGAPQRRAPALAIGQGASKRTPPCRWWHAPMALNRQSTGAHPPQDNQEKGPCPPMPKQEGVDTTPGTSGNGQRTHSTSVAVEATPGAEENPPQRRLLAFESTVLISKPHLKDFRRHNKGLVV